MNFFSSFKLKLKGIDDILEKYFTWKKAKLSKCLDASEIKKGSKKTLSVLFKTKIGLIRPLLFWCTGNRRRQEALRRINPSPGAETNDDVDQTFSKGRPCVKLLRRRWRHLCETQAGLFSKRNRYTLVIRSYENLERILQRQKMLAHLKIFTNWLTSKSIFQTNSK